MMNLPAICDKCNFIFASGFIGGGSMTNCTAGPCPRCGSVGHVPDGTYSLIDNVIHILNAPQKTIDELKDLSKIFQKAKNNTMSYEDIHKELEGSPSNLTDLSELLEKSKTSKKEDLKFIITTILAVISILISIYAIKGEEKPNVSIEQVVNNIYIMQEPDVNKGHGFNKVNNTKVHRNDKCTCGSGLKYKFCHGR